MRFGVVVIGGNATLDDSLAKALKKKWPKPEDD